MFPIPYLLTPWCRVLLEKLTGLQLVKKFPAFHETRRFITALTSVRHLSLSWASPIQSIYPHPTSSRSVLILSTHLCLGLPSGLLPSGFPTKTLYTPLSSPIRATCPAHLIFSILLPAQYWVRSTNHLAPRYVVSSISSLPRPSSVQIFSSTISSSIYYIKYLYFSFIFIFNLFCDFVSCPFSVHYIYKSPFLPIHSFLNSPSPSFCA